jgi:hypothetical protein
MQIIEGIIRNEFFNILHLKPVPPFVIPTSPDLPPLSDDMGIRDELMGNLG